MVLLSGHADRRCKERGVSSALLQAIIDHADVEADAGDGCRLLRVRRQTAVALRINDRLHRFAVIWSERNGRVVTVLPLHSGHSGRRYRKVH